MTCGVRFCRSLNQITIITATASPTAMIELTTMPAIAPIGRVLHFSITESEVDVGAVELRPPSDVGLTNREIVSVLLGVMVGIGPFAGFVSLAYSANDGVRRV
jgi:hypothetical protein